MKRLFLFLCIVLPSYVFGQGYVISGEVKGSAEGQTVSLKQYRDMQLVDAATAKVTGGKFSLKGNAPYPEFCALYVGTKGPLQFFVENSSIRIIIDLENLELSTVTGSKENLLFMEFVGELNKFAAKQQQLNDSYVTMSTSSVATPAAVAGLREQLEKLNTDRVNYMAGFVQNHPGKISTAFIVSSTLMQVLSLPQLEHVLSGFSPAAAQSQWVKMIAASVTAGKRTAIGQPFPDITLKTPDDKPVSISSYAGKGKYVLLDFWASWCGPCRNANPRVVELYRRYKDKGFEIVGISLDQDKNAWIKAIKDDNLTWPQMSDLGYWQSAAAKLYSVTSIPHTVLLGKDGKIIAKGLYTDALAAKLAELMD